MNVLCEPPKVGVGTLLSLAILRKLSSSPSATVETLADVGKDPGQSVSKVRSNNIVATATGKIGEKYLGLIMSRVKCSDDGVYICVSSFFILQAGKVVHKKQNRTISASLSVEGMDKS